LTKARFSSYLYIQEENLAFQYTTALMEKPMKTTPSLSMAENQVPLKFPLFVVLGALAWFIAVIFIRFAGAAFFIESSFWLVGLYVLSIPGAWLTIKGIAQAGKLSGVKILMAVAIMCFTASLLDGVAIAWFPSLYGLPTPAHLLAAAWLLWFVGVSLSITVIMTRREIVAYTTD
jgi:hypothetical protein